MFERRLFEVLITVAGGKVSGAQIRFQQHASAVSDGVSKSRRWECAVFGVVRFCGVGASCAVLDISITSRVYTTNGGGVGLAFTTYRAKKFSIAVAVSSGESSCTACPVFGSNAS